MIPKRVEPLVVDWLKTETKNGVAHVFVSVDGVVMPYAEMLAHEHAVAVRAVNALNIILGKYTSHPGAEAEAVEALREIEQSGWRQ